MTGLIEYWKACKYKHTYRMFAAGMPAQAWTTFPSTRADPLDPLCREYALDGFHSLMQARTPNIRLSRNVNDYNWHRESSDIRIVPKLGAVVVDSYIGE